MKNRERPLYVLVNKRGYKQGSNVLYEYGSPYSYIQGNLVEGPIDNIDSIIAYANASKNAANKYSVESFLKQLESFTPKNANYLNSLLNDALATTDVSLEVPMNIYAGTNENADLSNFATNQSFNIEEATLHSGGAIGADSMWDVIGSAFGLKNKRHYYHGEKNTSRQYRNKH